MVWGFMLMCLDQHDPCMLGYSFIEKNRRECWMEVNSEEIKTDRMKDREIQNLVMVMFGETCTDQLDDLHKCIE